MTRSISSWTYGSFYRLRPLALLLLAMLGLGACAAVLPTEPQQIIATPPAGKALSAFQKEDAACRQYAAGKMPSDLKHASSDVLQHQYDTAYAQCMTVDGNQIQVAPIIYQYSYYDPWYDPFWGGSVFIGGGDGFHHHHHFGHYHHH
ncbi:MAG TPA: hypothetical protein VL574_16515 [Stellaceae bacterium]|jgi:hypothetical protein|nr:hypothetical protein [Stellaceae bacterium]